MKYIDSEKLLAEIKIIQQSIESRDVRFNQVKRIRTECLIEFCKCITNVIDSLQHQQQDVFIEKACEWLMENVEKHISADGEYAVYYREMSEDFKNYMKGE